MYSPCHLEMGDPVLLGLHFARGRKARAPALQVQKVAFLQEMDKVTEKAHKMRRLREKGMTEDMLKHVT